MRALILAGSRSGGDPLAGIEGAPHKALIEVGGTPMMARVHKALAAAGFEEILVSADHPAVVALAEAMGARIVRPGRGPSESVGIAFAESASPMLVTTADHALLKPAWVRQLVDGTPTGSDVSILLASRDRVERAVSSSKRTWLRFADGEWSGCNLFLLATPAAAALVARWRYVETNRKRPWRIAAGIGVATLFDYARGRLGIHEAVERLGARMGGKVRIVEARDGLAAVDADSTADLALIRRVVSSVPE